MRSLRIRLVVWFTLGILAVTLVFSAATYLHLYEELHEKQVELAYPDHPDWRLHGNSSSEEIRDIMREIMQVAVLFAAPFLAAVVLIGYFIAGKSLKPIAELNEQMSNLTPATIGAPIKSSARDSEFQSLTAHLNALLERLDQSFNDIREYAAQIAHELRTPLTILRLKVEQSDQLIDPKLQEELQEELHRLSQMVDHSLLIARSEKGTLNWSNHEVNVSELVSELQEDFQLLASEHQRPLRANISTNCLAKTDRQHLKQILQGLFSNALKHGNGAIAVRLSPMQRGRNIHFLIVNEISTSQDDSKSSTQGLGLGLRVVQALLNLQSGIKFQRHHGHRYYAARLILPTVERTTQLT